MRKEIDLEKYKAMYQNFLYRRHTAVLSFVDENGKPFSSITPIIRKNNKFYIYISLIAEHYKLAENSDFIDVLIHADESETKNKFATERVRFTCKPHKLGNEGHDGIFELFDATFGEKTMKLLRGLDFSLFELTPGEGRYVAGFGLAFKVTLDADKFEHVGVNKKSK